MKSIQIIIIVGFREQFYETFYFPLLTVYYLLSLNYIKLMSTDDTNDVTRTPYVYRNTWNTVSLTFLYVSSRATGL